ncbi:MAG: low molecular weight protein-tyrosine-phosphatase [Gammaproteobacteria bacterium]
MVHKTDLAKPAVRILLVCLGNICRSPTAHGVLQQLIEHRGLQERIAVDSAGTGDWHIGAAPDKRSSAAAALRGYDLEALRARQVCAEDFDQFDLVLAMDRTNLKDLRAQCPTRHHHKLKLFLDYGSGSHDAVPDPYYSGAQGFELVLDLVEDACEKLLESLQDEYSLDRPVS